jgi:hypothetical protein
LEVLSVPKEIPPLAKDKSKAAALSMIVPTSGKNNHMIPN